VALNPGYSFFSIFFSLCLIGQEAKPLVAPQDRLDHLPGLLLSDGKAVLEAPLDWDHKDWALAGTAMALVIGTGFVLDHSVDDAVLRNRRPSWDRAAQKVESLGGVGGAFVVGGVYLVGRVMDDREWAAAGVDAAFSVLIARGLAFPIKELVGRARPEEGFGPDHFHPLHHDGFPSGHVTQAFAMAAAFSAHLDSPWEKASVYGLASLVAVARLEQRAHYTSDVLAAALLGTATGWSVTRLNRVERIGNKPVQMSWMPSFGSGQAGLAFQVKF
jgi:membrane-associated phospholipid phosphatase